VAREAGRRARLLGDDPLERAAPFWAPAAWLGVAICSAIDRDSSAAAEAP
jgi:hypothetical protein